MAYSSSGSTFTLPATLPGNIQAQFGYNLLYMVFVPHLFQLSWYAFLFHTRKDKFTDPQLAYDLEKIYSSTVDYYENNVLLPTLKAALEIPVTHTENDVALKNILHMLTAEIINNLAEGHGYQSARQSAAAELIGNDFNFTNDFLIGFLFDGYAKLSEKKYFDTYIDINSQASIAHSIIYFINPDFETEKDPKAKLKQYLKKPYADPRFLRIYNTLDSAYAYSKLLIRAAKQMRPTDNPIPLNITSYEIFLKKHFPDITFSQAMLMLGTVKSTLSCSRACDSALENFNDLICENSRLRYGIAILNIVEKFCKQFSCSLSSPAEGSIGFSCLPEKIISHIYQKKSFSIPAIAEALLMLAAA